MLSLGVNWPLLCVCIIHYLTYDAIDAFFASVADVITSSSQERILFARLIFEKVKIQKALWAHSEDLTS